MARLAVLVVVAGLLALPASQAGGAAGPVGYDGKIPFDCQLQMAGQGTEFPHPDADPFCVDYDKTHQNVTELGVVDFLSKEPARVAIAGPKCWYFQRDHWTGSIVQDDGSTQTYHWDGSYFYDKARGLGGVYIENFTINGQTGDPTTLPGFPEDWKPFFGPGRGGVMTTDSVRLQPDCVAKAKQAPPPGPYACPEASGSVRSGIGALRLGITRKEAEDALGPPARQTGTVARWCTADGGKLVAAWRSDHLAFALTTSPAFSALGAVPGKSSAKVRRRVPKLLQRGGVAVLAARSSKRVLLFGVDRKLVRFIAVVAPGASQASIGRWLDAAR